MSNDSQRAAEEVRGAGVDRQDFLGQGRLEQEGEVAPAEKGMGNRGRIETSVRGNINEWTDYEN